VPPPESVENSTEQTRWFSDEVQPHTSALRSYVKHSFPFERDVDDIVQESLLRIWRVRLANPVRSAKALLFEIARHTAIDLTRRKKVSPIDAVSDLANLSVVENGMDAINVITKQEKILLLAQAIDDLPAKCREVVVLRKLKLLSQREVADRLGLAGKTVEAHLARGVKRCEAYLRKRGVQNSFSDEAR
jgi:RNA polymerase sigma factor (sigma-70 family)